MSKRYYWLKLKDDFFTQKEIKKLRRIAGGDTYTIIYLKLQLLSIKNEGKLFFEGIEDTFIEEMALTLDEEPENVRVTLNFLQRYGLIEEVSTDEYLLPQAMESLGSETDVAVRVRRHRENQKMLHGNTDETFGNTEIERREEIDKEIDTDTYKEVAVTREPKIKKIKYAEFVSMTEEEYQKLVSEHGETLVKRMIEVLDNYKGANGKKYKSDYRAILNWVIERVKNNGKRGPGNKQVPKKYELIEQESIRTDYDYSDLD